jgi:hypothetical protein
MNQLAAGAAPNFSVFSMGRAVQTESAGGGAQADARFRIEANAELSNAMGRAEKLPAY